MMMVSKSMKVLNIIAGVLLMALGVYCLCNQDIADFGRRRHSDRGWVRLHDGSVGERCGNRRDGRAGLPAGRCQRRGLRLHPARQVSPACLQILLQSKAFQIDIES